MIITELQQLYATHPNVEGMCKLLKDNSVRHLYCSGLCASAASLFSSVLVQQAECPFVFILGDLEEAGYFYQNLCQVVVEIPRLFQIAEDKDKRTFRLLHQHG